MFKPRAIAGDEALRLWHEGCSRSGMVDFLFWLGMAAFVIFLGGRIIRRIRLDAQAILNEGLEESFERQRRSERYFEASYARERLARQHYEQGPDKAA